MSQPFEIDTDALGRAEAPFRELAQRLVALSNQVQAQVSGLGEVWGDDKSGQGFVEKYGPARDDLLQAFSSTGDVVTSTADGVRTMAQGYQRTEESNSDASSQLLRHALTARTDGLLSETTSGTGHLAPTATLRRARMDVAQPAGQLEPTRSLRMRADQVVPLQPMQAARRVRADEAVPLQPVQAARRDTVTAPLEPALRMRALPDQSVPAVPAVPAIPTVPARTATDLSVPAVAGAPAVPTVPARTAADLSVPAVPGAPAEPLQPVQVSARVPAEVTEPLQAVHRDVPAEPLLPALETRRVVDAPLVDETRPAGA